ncbi:hypothetical protein B0H11DRAFT_1287870 [Mycena galericulata]|nr:hypothetical protein B0H11DRAFT_1287870 [Mycena galericulata]
MREVPCSEPPQWFGFPRSGGKGERDVDDAMKAGNRPSVASMLVHTATSRFGVGSHAPRARAAKTGPGHGSSPRDATLPFQLTQRQTPRHAEGTRFLFSPPRRFTATTSMGRSPPGSCPPASVPSLLLAPLCLHSTPPPRSLTMGSSRDKDPKRSSRFKERIPRPFFSKLRGSTSRQLPTQRL